MTTPTPHGQVPEALIDLIDAYADRCGSIYNAKTEAARKAVIEALSGVQALSAAPAVPAGWKAVPVNPTPEMWKAAKTVPDPNPPYPPHYGLVWDAMLAATPIPPAEQQARWVERWHGSGGKEFWEGWSILNAANREMIAHLGPDVDPDAVRGIVAAHNEALCGECAGTGGRWCPACAGATPPAEQQAAPKAAPGGKFQTRVQPWLLQCFGAEIAADTVERNHRFLEEALELVQSTGCTQSEAHQLVDYVFGRPVGDPAQEVGGVMVTLAALCLANGLDMHNAGEIELARIWTKVEAIRAKQAAKPKHSPLPQSAPQQEAQEPVATLHCNDVGYVWARATEVGKRMRFEQPLNLYTAPQPAPAPLSDDVVKDAAFEAVRKKLCALPRYSFVLDDDGLVRRAPDRTGNWIEFDEAHALFDPVSVEAALAAQGGKNAG